MDYNSIYILYIMYITMFLAVLHYNNKLDKMNKFAILLFITGLFSYIINKSSLLCNSNRPSSALIAPVVISL
jgi:hypothetical protein